MNHQNPTYLKRRSGIYYFTRRIPSILQQQYKRDRVYVSLKTRNRRKAMAASERISCELEALWSQSQIDSVASLINSKYQMGDVTQGLPLISEALETYIELKGKDKSPNFESSVRRSVTGISDKLDVPLVGP